MSSQGETTALKKGQRNEMRMIARAADVLRALSGSSDGLSLGQIAKATGLARSTVQRLVGALEVEGFVMTQAGAPGVTLGRELARLGAAAHESARALFRPHLQALSAATRDTVDLTLLTGGAPVVVDQITATAPLRVVSFVGRPLPLHCTASGKAHLSRLPRAEAEKLLRPPLQAYTRRTIVDPAALLDRAGEADAVFVDIEEFDEGVCALALPIRVPGAENYAVAISMPSTRFPDRVDLLCNTLRACRLDMEGVAG